MSEQCIYGQVPQMPRLIIVAQNQRADCFYSYQRENSTVRNIPKTFNKSKGERADD